jgi:hypothetical protein
MIYSIKAFIMIEEYLKRGWHLLPCHTILEGKCSCRQPCKSPGKHPKTRNGVLDAKPEWNYPGYNVAVRTGPESGIWVLDIDCEINWDFETFTTSTGIGKHFFFNYVDGITNRAKIGGRKVDVRGINGYAILPPSRHINGKRYSILKNLPIIDAPQWLLEEIL